MLEVDHFPGPHSVTGGEPGLGIVIAQVVLALGLIIAGAQVFVGAVEHLSMVVGLDPTILALIIAPIATELPEKFNSVLWVRNGKDTLAMGNITGAMVFQSCAADGARPALHDLDLHRLTSAIHFASARRRLRVDHPHLRRHDPARPAHRMGPADRRPAVPGLHLPGALHRSRRLGAPVH